MASIECYIGNGPDAYSEDPNKSLGTGKFHSMANDENHPRRTLRLVKLR